MMKQADEEYIAIPKSEYDKLREAANQLEQMRQDEIARLQSETDAIKSNHLSQMLAIKGHVSLLINSNR